MSGQWDASRPPEEEAPIQIDAFGGKVKGAPSPDTSPRPESGRELIRAIGRRLLSVGLGPFELLDDALQGARALIRGLTRLPADVGSRVRRAHALVDRREDDRQTAIKSGDQPPRLTDAATKVAEIVARLQAKGIPVGVNVDEDGSVIVLAVPRDLQPSAAAAAQRVLASLQPANALTGPAEETDASVEHEQT